MNNDITPAAETAREAARRQDGKFGQQHRGEATNFTAPGTPSDPAERGYFTVAELTAEHLRDANWSAPDVTIISGGAVRQPSEGRFRSVKMRIGGEPYVKHTTRMAADTYPPIPEERDGWDARACKKVTVLAHLPGSGDVGIRQGTIAIADGRPALITKGSRTGAGVWLDDPRMRVLAIADGYNQGRDLAQTFTERMEIMPQTRPFTLDGIPAEATGQRTPAAVFLVNHPGFDRFPGHAVDGCVFVATDITEDGNDPIVNGYFWAPAAAAVFSEFSSMHRSDMERTWGACRLEGTPAFTLDDPMLQDRGRKDDMYAWLANSIDYD